ncbi:aminoacyl-tRNA hydrolase [Methylocapsa palsarum]|uniref:Peptidyl-tRNA hydrolase n=1 Tax=Methylocapsa palsarum TaxID=1612308 RepID=A0A1I4CER4_9HYPH|nr:aminoacyl-tRNA hydrolase [Methylocapsa palsarum]SFK78501.1 peptidyl-tRNA hydrolase, PTH1 family [Methylocapsa palsarum]
MLLFVGLGNAGKAYSGNRHNIGFKAIDAVAVKHGAPSFRARFQGHASEITLAGERVTLLKPGTFMNLSGQSVGEAARFYKIALSDIVVFHDELDLPAGKVRVKTGGGNAGHNGLRSVTEHVGNDYRRVRIGIGHPGDKALVHNYVLGDFAKAEAQWVDGVCAAAADYAGLLAKGEDEGFQNKVHLAVDAILRRDEKG